MYEVATTKAATAVVQKAVNESANKKATTSMRCEKVINIFGYTHIHPLYVY